MASEIKKSIIYVIPTIFTRILPLVTLPIFTRILTKEDYGAFALATIYAIFINGFINFGFTTAYERNYFEFDGDRTKSQSLLKLSILFVSISFILFSSTSFIFESVLTKNIIRSAGYEYLINYAMCGYFLYDLISQFYFIHLKNQGNATLFSKFIILKQLTYSVSAVLFIVFLNQGVYGIPLAQIVSGIILFILMSKKMLVPKIFQFEKKMLFEMIKISYPLTPRIFMGVINTQFDKYMIGIIDSVGGTGIYHLGKKISEYVYQIMTAFQNVYGPQVYKFMFEKSDSSEDKVGEYLTPFIYVSVLFALIMTVVAEDVTSILLPPDYSGVSKIISIMSCYYAILFFSKIVGTQLIFAKKTIITSILSVKSILLNVLINIPMIIKYGVYGAAYATLITSVVSYFIGTYFAQRQYRIKWEYKKIASIYSILLFSMLISVLDLDSISTFIIYVLKVMVVGLYVYLGSYFGYITKDNYMNIRNIITKRK